jgi:O-antigen/teichoic acid export membrane protein
MSKFDLPQLKKGAGFLLNGQILQAAASFGVNLVLVRYLLPEEFGHFALIMAGAVLVYAVFSLRFDVLIIRASDEYFTKHRQDIYFNASILETLLSSALLVGWLIFFDDMGAWEIGLITALGIRHWTGYNKAFYERTMPFRKLAVLETLVSLGGSVVALVFLYFGFGANILYIREFFLSFAGLIGLWWIGGLAIRRISFPRLVDWKNLLLEIRGIWLDGMLENSFNRIVILLVGFLGGERTVGFFVQAQRLSMVPGQLIGPVIIRVAGNWFSRVEDRQKRRDARDKLLMVLALPMSIMGGLCYFFADPVVPWLFGEGWRRSAELFGAMCGVVVFINLFELLRTYCWVSRHVRWMLFGRIALYIGCLLPAGAAYQGWIGGGIALSVGLSISYMFGFALVFALLKIAEQKWVSSH